MQLSGGQQQRVALARAIVNNPRVLLLDEPLGALDLKLRKQMQLELKRIQHEIGITFVHVTHDQEEAMTMADTIAVMNGGRIEQLGSPAELYERPQTAFVAGFLGKSNLLEGTVAREGVVRLGDGTELRGDTGTLSGRRLGRRPAREGRARRRRREPAQGHRQGDRLLRRRDRGRRRDVERRPHRLPPERRGRGGRPPAWHARRPVLVAGGDLRHPEWRGVVLMTRMTRRELVQRGAAGVTVLSLPGLLAACGGGGGGSGGSTEANDVLNFSNWPLYIDFDEKTKKHPTLDAFTAQTGIKVNYYEDINDNSSYFAKVQGPLSQGQSIDRDIFVFTDNSRYPQLLVDKTWVEPLQKDKIPNFSNLIDAQASPSFDSDRTYSLPWQSGMTGIAYNEDVTGPVTSIDQLLGDAKLKGKVTMLTEMADSVGLVMLDTGDDPSVVTDATFNKAIDRVQKAVDDGQIRRFTGNDYAQPLTKGDIAAAVAWSGDVVQLLASNPKLKWVVPEKGAMIWTDNMFVPLGGSSATASTYMNFVYDPKIAAQIAAYVNYVTPVKGAKEELAKTDPETANNTLIFPSDEMLSQVHQFSGDALNNETYITAWQKVLGA